MRKKSEYIPHSIRLKVLERAGIRCEICGKVGRYERKYGRPTLVEVDGGKAFHFHHDRPLSAGGRTTTFNVKLVCARCHTEIQKLSRP
jgi:predicted HNH restriction endonuclease